jgi:hypothetical protein
MWYALMTYPSGERGKTKDNSDKCGFGAANTPPSAEFGTTAVTPRVTGPVALQLERRHYFLFVIYAQSLGSTARELHVKAMRVRKEFSFCGIYILFCVLVIFSPQVLGRTCLPELL